MKDSVEKDLHWNLYSDCLWLSALYWATFLNFAVVKPFFSLSFGKNSTWERWKEHFPQQFDIASIERSRMLQLPWKALVSSCFSAVIKSCISRAALWSSNYECCSELHWVQLALQPFKPLHTLVHMSDLLWSILLSLPGKHNWNCRASLQAHEEQINGTDVDSFSTGGYS